MMPLLVAVAVAALASSGCGVKAPPRPPARESPAPPSVPGSPAVPGSPDAGPAAPPGGGSP
jgi:hypothetical protein